MTTPAQEIRATTAEVRPCLHCKSPIPEGYSSEQFCCHGCEAVYGLLQQQGLGRYYELAGSDVAPAPSPTQGRSHTWLEPLFQHAEAQPDTEMCSLSLDVQGIHCAACVWLMNETYRKTGGATEITVNPALGKVRLVWRKGALDLADWVSRVEAFGYQFGPARKEHTKRSIDLPLRLGISAALWMNVMLFSISFYFGLSPDDPDIFRLFTWLSAALSTGVVFIGGWPFFKAAIQSLKNGALHLDLPIAVGIVLVYAVSLAQLRVSGGRGDLSYFDTLNTFITLMLTGRLLQERVLERNRRFLLEDDGADGLLVRKVVGERLQTMKAPLVQAGDLLLVAPGDLVPVDATLVEDRATISTDWITGEARPRTVLKGGEVGAGSFNAGREAFHVIAAQHFAQSQLVSLLRQPSASKGEVPEHMRLWNTLAKGWVVGVLALASLGFLLWLPTGLIPAVNVAVALLVVTCPCAIGIAIPLAYELSQSRLRRAGFYVRATDLLDRLVKVRQLLFDKTGTLTLGRLELVDRASVEGLAPTARDVAYNLAVRSAHPVSSCLSRELERLQARYDATATAQEVHGKGMEWTRPDGTWRLGRSDWAAPGSEPRRTVLAKDDVEVQAFVTREAVRNDARAELAELMDAGYGVWLISGDAQERVSAFAQSIGVDPTHALGGRSPDQKAAEVERLDRRDTLFLGDGVNDALAFGKALAAGTPAIDRPVMPGRSDFFLVGEGLSPIKAALTQSLHLRRVIKRILTMSLLYNAFVVVFCLLGLMSPLVAAIAMPASTVSLIFRTVWALQPNRGADALRRDGPRGSVNPALAVMGVRP